MHLRNDLQGYGLVAVLLHWIMAVLVIGLFVLGEYMVGLNYDDPWYIKAPDLHRGIGVIVAILLVLRLGWRWSNRRPEVIGQAWERSVALWVHRSFYVLLAAIPVSGYLITTADGQALCVFGWFELPATFYGVENQEDIAGLVHEWLAMILISLVVLHTLAAMKHHFIDRDASLRRMLGSGAPPPRSPATAMTPKE